MEVQETVYRWNYVDKFDGYRGESVYYNMTPQEIEEKIETFKQRGVVELTLKKTEIIKII